MHFDTARSSSISPPASFISFKHKTFIFIIPHYTPAMLSPQELQSYNKLFNPQMKKPMGGAIVPKFMFPINNKSSDPKPRKEAFKFRDGLIIVTTPILSEEDVHECLKKACHAFDIRPPVPSDLVPITHHIPATPSTAHVKRTAALVRARKSNPNSQKQADWQAKNFSYFLLQQDTITYTPDSMTPESPAHPLPTHQQKVVHNKHTEDVFERPVDKRPFRARLVPNVKMEAAKRKQLAKEIKIQAGKSKSEGDLEKKA
jgi:hypothetical protein